MLLNLVALLCFGALNGEEKFLNDLNGDVGNQFKS